MGVRFPSPLQKLNTPLLELVVRVVLETIVLKTCRFDSYRGTKEVDTLYVDDFVRPHRCAPLTKPLFNIVRWQIGKAPQAWGDTVRIRCEEASEASMVLLQVRFLP